MLFIEIGGLKRPDENQDIVARGDDRWVWIACHMVMRIGEALPIPTTRPIHESLWSNQTQLS